MEGRKKTLGSERRSADFESIFHDIEPTAPFKTSGDDAAASLSVSRSFRSETCFSACLH
jgi:hypothetical protein